MAIRKAATPPTTTPTPVQPRFMGFPALTWDGQVEEPYCTGCMVCIRQCPTQCMSASMKDNPKHADGESSRRKIIDYFEINLNRCILCGICVEVCNFDAIVMSHEHEMSTYQRNGDRVDLPALLQIGMKYQEKTSWVPPTVLAKRKQEAEAASAEAVNTEATPGAAAGATRRFDLLGPCPRRDDSGGSLSRAHQGRDHLDLP